MRRMLSVEEVYLTCLSFLAFQTQVISAKNLMVTLWIVVISDVLSPHYIYV